MMGQLSLFAACDFAAQFNYFRELCLVFNSQVLKPRHNIKSEYTLN